MPSISRILNRQNTLQPKSKLANGRVLPSKQTLAHALRVLAPTLFALTFAGAAHAQGTMDFSGAQTLMGTFKTILRILKQAGGWHHGLYLKIENARWPSMRRPVCVK
jgi:hypothetical protein